MSAKLLTNIKKLKIYPLLLASNYGGYSKQNIQNFADLFLTMF